MTFTHFLLENFASSKLQQINQLHDVAFDAKQMPIKPCKIIKNTVRRLFNLKMHKVEKMKNKIPITHTGPFLPRVVNFYTVQFYTGPFLPRVKLSSTMDCVINSEKQTLINHTPLTS